ncbi:MAG: sigma-70 family RNA polymerase sigma factor [Actinomycetota bacterium]
MGMVETTLGRVAAGDEQAFARFYDLTSSVVFGVALRVLGNQAMAEEVTQEVFVELWRIAPRYDRSKGSPQAWAATVAHRRAVDRVRSEQASRSRDAAERSKRRAAEEPGVDAVGDVVVTRIDQERVSAALDQLPEPQRVAVTMAYYGGHTYRQVADLLHEPEGTIKSRIRDGLTRLRQLMDGER